MRSPNRVVLENLQNQLTEPFYQTFEERKMKAIFGFIALLFICLQLNCASPNGPDAPDDSADKTDKIVFTQPRLVIGQDYGLAVVNPDGSNLQMIGPNMNVQSFSVSDDESILVFVNRTPSPPGEIYSLRMPHLALDALRVQGANPIISPDGQSVAFIVYEENTVLGTRGLGIANPNGSNFRMLLQQTPTPVGPIKWSNDSKSIIYRFQGAFFSIASDGNSDPVMLNISDPFNIEPVFEFSSDAFTGHRDIGVPDSLRFYPHEISHDGSHAFKAIGVVTLIPPRQRIVNYYLFSYDLNRNTAALLAHSPESPIFAATWSPATLQLAFATREGIDVVNVENVGKKRIVNFNAMDNSTVNAVSLSFRMMWLRF
jgi:hypothetical protein